MDRPVTVINTGHKIDIISGKDLPEDIKWAYFKNGKLMKRIKLGKTLTGLLRIRKFYFAESIFNFTILDVDQWCNFCF